jgi:hypothetical protein
VRSLLLVLILAAAGSGPLTGQRLAVAYPHWDPELQSDAPAPFTSLSPKATDHRWEGLLIGGAAVGLLGAIMGNAFCGSDDSAARPNCLWPTIEGFAIGATVGGVTGGLLGSLIPKK